MKVIESFLKSKFADETKNEDALVITDKCVAVIDGVTAKGKHLWQDGTSGRHAAQLICRALYKEENLLLPPERLFQLLSDLLKASYKQEFDDTVKQEFPRACMILYNDNYKEIWSYGDCKGLINGEPFGEEKQIDKILSQKRAAVIRQALADGMTVQEIPKKDPGRAAIQEDLVMQFAYENSPTVFGYPVLNGDKIVPNFIGKKKAEPGDMIVLATDGYPQLFTTLEESEAVLSAALRDDPLCIGKLLGTKAVTAGNCSFDDRCYCRFVVE